jgi:hypothetical protein
MSLGIDDQEHGHETSREGLKTVRGRRDAELHD